MDGERSRQIEKLRAPLYRVSSRRRVRTISAAAQFIDQVGFCWLFAPAKSTLELPSLFEAVKGRRGMQIEDWDTDSERVWGWKSDLPAARRAYYGKGLAGKPGFASLKVLPALLACSGQMDLHQLYAHGGISYEAKKIYEVLDSLGPQPTMALRAAARLNAKEANHRYHRALDELQRMFFVMPMGATLEQGAWPSQIFELVARWFPEHAAQARDLDLAAARFTLTLRYLKTVLAAPASAIARLFGFSRTELDPLIAELTRRNLASVEGDWLWSMPPSSPHTKRRKHRVKSR